MQEERQTSIRYSRKALRGNEEIQRAVEYWERTARFKISVHEDDSGITLVMDRGEPLTDRYAELWLGGLTSPE